MPEFEPNPLYIAGDDWEHLHTCKRCMKLGISSGSMSCYQNPDNCDEEDPTPFCERCIPLLGKHLMTVFSKYPDQGKRQTWARVKYIAGQPGVCGRCTEIGYLYAYNVSGSVRRCDKCAMLHKKVAGIWLPLEDAVEGLKKAMKSCACNGCSGKTS